MQELSQYYTSHAGSLGVQSMLRDKPNIDYQISIRYERTFLYSHRTKIASKSVNSLLKRGLINLARKQQLTSHKLILHFYPPLPPLHSMDDLPQVRGPGLLFLLRTVLTVLVWHSAYQKGTDNIVHRVALGTNS